MRCLWPCLSHRGRHPGHAHRQSSQRLALTVHFRTPLRGLGHVGLCRSAASTLKAFPFKYLDRDSVGNRTCDLSSEAKPNQDTQ
jgi:hypothetical protein